MLEKFTLEVIGSLSVEDWMAILAILAIFKLGIARLLFGHITVKHIEREMAKEGILPPEWDKGVGMRYSAYASIILRPNAKRHSSIVDIDATKRFSRKVDWYLAVFVKISTAFFITILMFSAYYLYGSG
jgi:hypothetical protein